VVLEPTQVEPHHYLLRPNGVLIAPESVDASHLPSRKTLNVALLGALSTHLPVPEEHWLEALRVAFPESFFEANRQAFSSGRQQVTAPPTQP
jgi:indolepyruvate ferredoxin oxidoreductase beta subunit